MAEVVLGMCTSHLPSLNVREGNIIERWARAAQREESPGLRGGGMLMNLDIPKLKKERESWIGKELTPEVWQRRADSCQAALNELTRVIEETAPDVAIVISDDSYEVFLHGHMPAVDMFTGTAYPWQRRDFARGDGPAANMGGLRRMTGSPELATHIANSFMDQGFDISVTTEFQEGQTIGHGFDFVYGRIMNEKVPDTIPVFLNTYYAPNRLRLSRCYAIGKALRRGIESWDSDARVAVIGSGGLTHMIIDEALDHEVLDALQEKDEAHFKDMSEVPFEFGTSETRCWIFAAGAMHESDMTMHLAAYEPGYRSAAGLGCACGFAYWK